MDEFLRGSQRDEGFRPLQANSDYQQKAPLSTAYPRKVQGYGGHRMRLDFSRRPIFKNAPFSNNYLFKSLQKREINYIIPLFRKPTSTLSSTYPTKLPHGVRNWRSLPPTALRKKSHHHLSILRNMYNNFNKQR